MNGYDPIMKVCPVHDVRYLESCWNCDQQKLHSAEEQNHDVQLTDDLQHHRVDGIVSGVEQQIKNHITPDAKRILKWYWPF